MARGMAGAPSIDVAGHGVEVAIEARAIAHLQELMGAAITAVCPGHESILHTRKESVRKRQNSATSPDLECHAPATLWRKLCVQCTQASI